MSFIAKNPLSAASLDSPPSPPIKGARGLFAGEDGWYDIDDNGVIKKIGDSDDSTLKQLCYYGNKDIVPSDESLFTFTGWGNGWKISANWNEEDKTITDIVIPYEYRGAPITAITLEGFRGYSYLKTVIFPNTIDTIEDKAFSFCGLTKVVFPESIENITFNAFEGCTSLESITFEGDKTHVAYQAFNRCTKLKDVYCKGSLDWLKTHVSKFFDDEKENNNAVFAANIHCDEFEPESLPVKNSNKLVTSGGVYKALENFVTREEAEQAISDLPTKLFVEEQITEALKGAGTSDFVVTADLDTVDGEPIIDNVSATFEDIKNAYDKGQNIVLKVWYEGHAEVIVPMLSISEVDAYFVLTQSVLPHLAEIVIREEGAFLQITQFARQDEFVDLRPFYIEGSAYLTFEEGYERVTLDVEGLRSPELYDESVDFDTVLRMCNNGREVVMKISVFYGETLAEVRIPLMTISSDIGAMFATTCSFPTVDYTQMIHVGWYSYNEVTLHRIRLASTNNVEEQITEALGEIERLQYYGDTNIEPSPDDLFEFTLLDDESGYEISAKNGIELEGTVVIPYKYNDLPVVEIGDFSGKSSITDVIIPNSVVSIGGRRAFYNCTNLTNITIPDSVANIGNEVFVNCTNLIHVTLPSNLTAISDYMFMNCTSLTSITIPINVTRIGDNAFRSCRNLLDVVIPNSVTSIGEGAFGICHSLTSVTIPNSVTSIGEGAFESCIGLTSITISSNITSIDGVFEACTSLTSITIPDSITNIGEYAFHSCDNLKSITIPNSVTSIGEWAFSECESLETVCYKGTRSQWKIITIINEEDSNDSFLNATIYYEIDDNPIENSNNLITSGGVYKALRSLPIGETLEILYYYGSKNIQPSPDELFLFELLEDGSGYKISTEFDSAKGAPVIEIEGTLVIPYKYKDLPVVEISDLRMQAKMTDIVIPNSITSIGDGAFYGCTDLTGVTIPSSVTTIGECAFQWCSGITSVTIPDNVVECGYGVFANCTNLTSVSLPKNIKSIASDMFNECSSLTSIIIPDGVTSIDVYAFAYCEGLTSIEIPKSLKIIDQFAFDGCSNLTDVYYEGTVSQWGDIEIKIGNSPLSTVTIHYEHHEIDDTPVENSTNLITSGAVYNTVGDIDTALENIIALQDELLIPDGDEVEY